MNTNDYLSGLDRLLLIYQQIEKAGVMAALKHKSELEVLTPALIKEAKRRAAGGE